MAIKRIVIWIAVAGTAALIVSALMPQPLPADFAVIERGSLRVTVDQEGETRCRNRFIVSAPSTGRVLRIELEPGDEVVADKTIMATFQPGDPTLLDVRTRAEGEARERAAEASHGRTLAELERSKAELSFARLDLERISRLTSEEIVAQDRLDAAELRVLSAEEAVHAAGFAVKSAEHELEAARASLLTAGAGETEWGGEPITIRSPTDGVVLRRLRESTAVVPAGEPLLEVGDPLDLEIVADVLSSDAVRISIGDRVVVERWGGDQPLNGRVRRIEPSGFTKISALGVEEKRVNVVVDLTDEHEVWGALGDGFRVEVRVVVWEREDVLLVPTAAIFRDGQSWATFVVEEGVVALRDIELGRHNGIAAEVLSGLAVGDTVMIHPSDAIADGAKVRARD